MHWGQIQSLAVGQVVCIDPKIGLSQNTLSLTNRTSPSFICIVEGLYLVYRQDLAPGGTGGLVACFYIDKMLESLVVASILVYGHFHAMDAPHHYWFWALCGTWCIVIIMSTVPVLSSAPLAQIAVAVEHPAMAICYALAAGCIFYTAIYFVFVNREHADRCDMIWRLLAFGAGLWIPFVTSLFM